MIFPNSDPEIIMTAKTYIDGVLEKETAKLIEDKPDFWYYALPITIALVIFHQMVMK